MYGKVLGPPQKEKKKHRKYFEIKAKITLRLKMTNRILSVMANCPLEVNRLTGRHHTEASHSAAFWVHSTQNEASYILGEKLKFLSP